MDALTALVSKALSEGILSQMPGVSNLQRMSIFADDVAMFLAPTPSDLAATRSLLNAFGVASGLRVNYAKSMAILIHGTPEDGDRVTATIQCTQGSFPCKYLRLQLAVRQLKKSDWDPL